MLNDTVFWYSILNVFTFSVFLYSTMHTLWQKSLTTYKQIIGFTIFGVLVSVSPIGVVVVYLIVFMSYMYFSATMKPKHRWYINEVL